MSLKAIIIDDFERDVQTMKAIISECCLELEVVGTANLIENGFNLIKKHKPDLVFLDVRMPRGDGFDLLDRFPIRNFEVIFVTAYETHRKIAEEYESFEYIEKPIDVNNFIEIIQRVIEFRKENPNKVYKRFPRV